MVELAKEYLKNNINVILMHIFIFEIHVDVWTLNRNKWTKSWKLIRARPVESRTSRISERRATLYRIWFLSITLIDITHSSLPFEG